jgi:excisionase family DNA binding protein
MQNYLTTTQVAALKGVHERTVRRWCEAGKVKAIGIGEVPHKVWLIDPESVEDIQKDSRGRKGKWSF